MSKSRRSLTTFWSTCSKCECSLTAKDLQSHNDDCPPVEPYKYAFVCNKIWYTFPCVYEAELPRNINHREADNMVFISESVLEICKISIGDPVLIKCKESFLVRIAWPMFDKSLSAAYFTKNAIELDKLEGAIQLQKVDSTATIASEIILQPIGKTCSVSVTSELMVLIKNYNHERIFCTGNRMSIPYYGKKLIYDIVDIKLNKTKLTEEFHNMSLNEGGYTPKLFLAIYNTKWIVLENTCDDDSKTRKNRQTLDSIGGYNTLITDLRDIFEIGLGKFGDMDNFHISKGILLYGTVGVGKSMLSEAILTEIDAYTVKITTSDIFSKNFRETESVVNKIVEKAINNAPSVIFIEDIDRLCPKKNSVTDNEKKILAILVKLFDDLQNNFKNIMVLATTSKPDSVDNSLRRPGRIDREFEMPVPTKQVRKEIILKIIEKMRHSLSEDDLDNISYNTHGFVGADLHGLCSQAATHAIKRATLNSQYDSSKIIVLKQDFDFALTVVNPSAMKEVLIDIPNVRWTDIGGQKDLKLKLVQAVEWPLKHPEVFSRIGILPPKGVLMFGPPGCSKTMIAKALATESKLNFLNIKGPELFSKWVGESERAVRELFRKARQVAPSIIFIDEIDALGAERTSNANNSGGNVQERVLAQLLTELDGVTALGNVTLVAATNRPDRIDKALLRPGRFDRLIYVPLPDPKTRMEIFEIKLKSMPICNNVILQDLVDLTEGYSGAEIQAICHEAGMKALEENLNATIITKDHFKVALSIVVPRTPQPLLKLYEDYINNM